MDSDANGAVQAVLDELADGGTQLGVQAAAYLDGELVVDAWSGLADPDTGRPVDAGTLFTVYSAGKAVVATCVHLLAERGQLDYAAPVADYWPAFAANGKSRVTVRHALTHRAGIPLLPPGTTVETLCDWEAMCAGVATLQPLWPPGARMGYHATTYGWILGELIHRVDGRSFAAFVQQEICRPLHLEGQLYFGIPDSEAPRVATANLGPPDPAPPDPSSLAERALPSPLRRIFNRSDVRRASIPAVNGLMTARALAAHYAALIGTGVDGVRLLPPKRMAEVLAPLPQEPDLVWGSKSAKGLGYLLGGPLPDGFDYDVGGRRSAFGHNGIGGNIGFADPEYGLTVAITITSPGGGSLGARRKIADAIRTALDIPHYGQKQPTA